MNKKIIVLISLFLCFLIASKNKAIAKDKEKLINPYTIQRILWLNENEILIADTDNERPGCKRILKYVISENKYIPVYNGDFKKDETVAFSSDGKTIATFDTKTRIFTMLRDNQVVLKKTIDFEDILCNDIFLKSVKHIRLFCFWIIIEKDYAFLSITSLLDDVRDHKMVLVNYKPGDALTEFLSENSESIFYLPDINQNCIYFMNEENEEDGKTKRRIYKYSFPDRKFTLFIKDVPKKLNNIYTITEKNGCLFIRSHSDVYVIDKKTTGTLKIIKDSRILDVSSNYLLIYTRKRRSSGTSHLIYIYPIDKIKDNKISKKEKVLLKDTYYEPKISPDETKIILFDRDKMEKPEIIETDRINFSSGGELKKKSD